MAGLKWLVGATQLRAYVESDISVIAVGQTFLAAVTLGIVSSIYPARRAMQVSPNQTLKYK
jgi:ABC-type lipoprotein release transport system permease subunit